MTGKELAERRKRAGLTQRQLSEYLEMSRAMVWRTESIDGDIPTDIEVGAMTVDHRRECFRKWISGLPRQAQAMIRRRQHRYNIRAIS